MHYRYFNLKYGILSLLSLASVAGFGTECLTAATIIPPTGTSYLATANASPVISDSTDFLSVQRLIDLLHPKPVIPPSPVGPAQRYLKELAIVYRDRRAVEGLFSIGFGVFNGMLSFSEPRADRKNYYAILGGWRIASGLYNWIVVSPEETRYQVLREFAPEERELVAEQSLKQIADGAQRDRYIDSLVNVGIGAYRDEPSVGYIYYGIALLKLLIPSFQETVYQDYLAEKASGQSLSYLTPAWRVYMDGPVIGSRLSF